MDVQDLELTGIIAFDGITKNGLQLHPDQEHMIYPMGNKVTIKNINSGTQRFFTGHTNIISALCVSPCGKYIASGQVNHLGFKAVVIIWDYEQQNIKGTHEIHKVRVEDVCFTCNSNYLISLGGRDDGNIVVWDVRKNEAICGSFASNETAGNACTITKMNLRDQCFISGGDRTLKVWRINPEMRKACGVNVKVGKLRRFINCIVVDARDENAYCGTSSGDIIKVRLNFHHNVEFVEPVKTPVMVGCFSKMCKNLKNHKIFEVASYSGGVWCLILLSDHRLIIGAGDGTVELVKISETESFPNSVENKLKLPTTPRIITLLKTIAHSAVTSMQVLGKTTVIVGTIFCEIYEINISNFDTRLIVTCHTNAIYDIAFPHNYSEVFATGSKNDIKVWRLDTQSELLRITIPNFVCSSLCFSYDGKMIISAWNDGLIRTFTPETGKLIFTIHNSHIKAVSAIAVTSHGRQIISGGCDGQVRVWEIKPKIQKLACVLKEHKGPVTSLDIAYNNEEVISASSDGTCIIWDLIRYVRKQVLMANTIYMAARFSPNGVQILTCGTNRKISYWETLDGSLVREVEGSSVGAVNCLDLSPDGKYFVTGSSDCIIKVWNYHTGEASHIGIGHAAIITACKFSPDSKYIVTVSADGAIMIWNWLAKSSEPIDAIQKYPGRIRSESASSTRDMELRKLALVETNQTDENVMALSTRSHNAESIRSIHAGSVEANSMPLECDLSKLTRGICKSTDREEKSPISEHSTSPIAKSIRSVQSAKSDSRVSSQLDPAMKNIRINNQADQIPQTSNFVCKMDKQQSARAKSASNLSRSKISPTMHCIQPLNMPSTRMNSNTKNYQTTTVPVKDKKFAASLNLLTNGNIAN